MEKKKIGLKCVSGKIKCFKTMLVFFFMENWGIEDPPSQLNGKIALTFFLFFFETVPNTLQNFSYISEPLHNF